MQKLTTVTTQGSANRDTDVTDKKFIEIYNKEFIAKRALPQLEALSKEDIVLEAQSAFTISNLKYFLESHEVKVDEEEEEMIGDETDVLKVTKVSDEGKDKVVLSLFRSMSCIPAVTKLRRAPSRRMWRLSSPSV